MAIAERHLAALFGGDIVDHTTYVLASDGDLMEGISQEAIALAGTSETQQTHRAVRRQRHLDRRPARARRIPWIRSSASRPPAGRRRASTATIPRQLPRRSKRRRNPSGRRSSPAAPRSASARRPRPAPRRATARRSAADEIAGARRALNWSAPPFEIPPAIRDEWRNAGARGRPARLAWEARLAALDPAKRAEFERRLRGDLTGPLAPAVAAVKQKLAEAPKEIATRCGF